MRQFSFINSQKNRNIALSDPAGYGITPGVGSDPCNRVDKVYFQPPGVIGAKKIGVAGVNVLGNSCYSGVTTAPDLSEVQYSLDGGVSWLTTFSNYTAVPSTLGIFNKMYIRQTDICRTNDLPSGTYNIAIRYKNWKYNYSPPSNWPVPFISTPATQNIPGASCLTYGNTNSNSYVYEYYPNVIIP